MPDAPVDERRRGGQLDALIFPGQGDDDKGRDGIKGEGGSEGRLRSVLTSHVGSEHVLDRDEGQVVADMLLDVAEELEVLGEVLPPEGRDCRRLSSAREVLDVPSSPVILDADR